MDAVPVTSQPAATAGLPPGGKSRARSDGSGGFDSLLDSLTEESQQAAGAEPDSTEAGERASAAKDTAQAGARHPRAAIREVDATMPVEDEVYTTPAGTPGDSAGEVDAEVISGTPVSDETVNDEAALGLLAAGMAAALVPAVPVTLPAADAAATTVALDPAASGSLPLDMLLALQQGGADQAAGGAAALASAETAPGSSTEAWAQTTESLPGDVPAGAAETLTAADAAAASLAESTAEAGETLAKLQTATTAAAQQIARGTRAQAAETATLSAAGAEARATLASSLSTPGAATATGTEGSGRVASGTLTADLSSAVSSYTGETVAQGSDDEAASDATAATEAADADADTAIAADARQVSTERGQQRGSGGQGSGSSLSSGSGGGAAGTSGGTSQADGTQATFPVFLGVSEAASPVSVTVPQATAAAGTGATAYPQVTQQVVQAVSLAWNNSIGQAQITLNPAHLGQVTVSLTVEGGRVSAVLQADRETAREWIRAHESDLREGLESQGLHLDSLVVTDDGGDQRRQDQSQSDARPKRSAFAAGPSDEAPRFEVQA